MALGQGPDESNIGSGEPDSRNVKVLEVAVVGDNPILVQCKAPALIDMRRASSRALISLWTGAVQQFDEERMSRLVLRIVQHSRNEMPFFVTRRKGERCRELGRSLQNSGRCHHRNRLVLRPE